MRPIPALLTAVLALPVTAFAGDAPPNAGGRVLVGSVRFQGRPVAGATVTARWLIGLLDKKVYSKPVVCDAEGRFTLEWLDDPEARPYLLFARDAAGRLGWADIRSVAEPHLPPGTRIELTEAADTHGRLTDTAGAPLRNAKVRVLYLSAGVGDEARTYDVPPIFADAMTTTTDADGRFGLKGMPAGGQIFAELSAEGFGSPRIVWPQQMACEMQLKKPGTLRVRIESADDPAKLVGLKLHPYLKQSTDRPVRFFTWGGVAIDLGESQSISNLVPGRYSLSIHSEWKSPYLAEPPTEVEVTPGGVADVTVKLTPAAELHGRVIDAKTRKGIAGVMVEARRPRVDGWGSLMLGMTTTGPDGQYRLWVQPGKVAVNGTFSLRPVLGYQVLPESETTSEASVAAGHSHTFPDIVLHPAVRVSGFVVDVTGKPLPWITIHTAHTLRRLDPVVSDAHGRFQLADLGPNEKTALRARMATATTDGAIAINVDDLKGPVKLVLSEANACRLRGKVADSDGRPIANASVRIEWRYPGVGCMARTGIGAWAGTMHADDDGHFESIALWPGDEYRVQVEARGFGKAESALVRGVTGQFYDFGTITLPRISGRVVGMVVDSRNRPIAGVRVFNSGDGPKPVSAFTCNDGRFTLEDLFDGSVCICARKAGHRFTAKFVDSRDEQVYVTMLPADAPPPANQPDPRPPKYVADLDKLTRHLLTSLWALPEDLLDTWRQRVLEGMARLDLPEAQRWLSDRRRRGEPGTDQASPLVRVLRIAEAEAIATTDADEALALLNALQGREAHWVLMRIAGRLRQSDPVRALRFAEEAAVKARAMQPPDNAWTLASVGDLIVQLGQRDAGRKLIFEAADIAQQLGAQGMHAYARGRVAARLAQFDLDRARGIVPRIDREYARWSAAIAVRIAAIDSEKALAILDEFRDDQSSFRADTRRRIATVLAEQGKTAEAAKLAESSLTDIFRPGTALSAVAVAAAKHDPQLARSLIDRALNYYLDPPSLLGDPIHTKTRSFAGWTAYQARLANHPDMQSVVGRVLAVRPTMQSDSPDRIARMHMETAIALSFVDPTTAKWLLDRAVPRNRPIPAGLIDSRQWLFAVALADPDRAIGEIDRYILRGRQSPQKLPGDLLSLLSILTSPSDDDRLGNIASYLGNSWPRDSEVE